MSNYLAIAAVTSTFSQWLLEKACSVLDGALTTIGRPKEGTSKGINIYLYQVMYNPDHRNENFPVRRSGDATFSQRPQAALDLYYLLTFYGSEKDLEPQILMGSTISVLNAQPVLTQDMLCREIKRRTDADAGDALAKYEASGQIQSIAFTPLSYNTEEFAKLWSMLFQITYTLSVAYKASAVFVEAEVTPQKALPVLRPDTYVLPFRRPFIEKISSASGDMVPIVYNSEIVVTGRQLKGDPTKVGIGEVEVKIDPTDSVNTVTDTEVKLNLSSVLFAGQSLRAGIQGMSVLHPIMMGDPKVEHYGFESNIKPMALCPTIAGKSIDGTAKTMTLTINPPVGKTQKVLALLNEFGFIPSPDRKIPYAYSIKAPDNNGITSDSETETNSITFSLAHVEPGDYLLRVQIDGAESALKLNSDLSDPKYISPQVNVH
jgi:hypothetical protein